MKKFLIMLVTSFSALLPISNLTNSINSNTHSEKTINVQNINTVAFSKSNSINKLDTLYKKRSTNLNKEIKNNLISAITLNNNKINIDYNLLNKKLFDSSTYNFLKSEDYLQSLNAQYQMQQIKFDSNHHIIFADDIHLLQFSGVWIESHWYWFGYWRLHLDSNRTQQIIITIAKLDIRTAGKYLIALLTDWELPLVAMTLAAFLLPIELSLINFDHGKGVCFAFWTLVPVNVWSN